jgi:FdhD protein
MVRPLFLQQPNAAVERRTVLQVRGARSSRVEDAIAIERALQIFAVAEEGEPRLVASTMRTPGSDVALSVGFLFAESMLQARSEVTGWRVDGDRVFLTLTKPAMARIGQVTRLTVGTSACGVCGREDPLGLVVTAISERASRFRILKETLERLPELLTERQAGFLATGGLHAAGLFSATGELWSIAEDVGRHNAVDKLIGDNFLAESERLAVGALVVSGRASFELVQKAARADIPTLISVGAPSTLAIETAERANMTLVGFTRVGSLNIYAGEQRVVMREVEL